MREFWQRRPGGAYWTNLFGRRRSTGCKSLRAARVWKLGKEVDGANPRLAAAKKARLDDAILEMLAELRRRGRAAGTIDKVRKKLGHFPRLWGEDRKLATIDAKLVDSYIDARLLDPGARADSTLSRTTIRDELGALRQTLKLARRQGLYPFAIDDVLPDRFEAGHTPSKDFVPFDRLGDLLVQVPTHRRAHVLFYCVTGGRTADSKRARREDFVTTGDWSITVRGSKTRKSWRTIPVPAFLRSYVEALLALAPGPDVLFEPWATGNDNRDIKAACVRAGLGPVSTNGLRRTFGHALLGAGYSLDIISKMFGHTTEKLAREVYANMDQAELAAAVARHSAGTESAHVRTNSSTLQGEHVQ
jgi:integrase